MVRGSPSISVILKCLDVVLAGGRQYFYSGIDGVTGEIGGRSDGENYLAEWEADKELTFIRTRDELLNYEFDDKTLIGLFAEGHLEYDLKRKEQEPELGLLITINHLPQISLFS